MSRPPWSGWSLRARLLVALIGLLAVVCTVIGGVTVIALNDYLLGQVDSQLGAAASRLADASRQAPLPFPPRPEATAGVPGFLLTPGQAPDTIGAVVVDGSVVESGVLADGGPKALPRKTFAGLEAISTDGVPHTEQVGDLGTYRLIATTTSTGVVLVIGLPLSSVQSTVYQMASVVTVVGGLGLLAAGLAGAVIVRNTLRPLHRVASTARRVSELPLDRGEVSLAERVPDSDTDPRTEVGQVGSALNRMLDHIGGALAARHASETRVRQFLADASHELRTPLAAIRGYSEVTRRGDQAVPADVAYAMQRVESETARMTSLVDDLLLLARLDSGRPLAREPVDLSRLVVDAVSDAHVAGPNHTWTLDAPERPVVVTGDPERLHQVLANLLANARTHTPSGTTVEVGLAQLAGSVRLTVADDGPGIPEDLRTEVFERFARGDTSRSRAAGSTGLGLAIVSAVVEAHDGSVDLESRPGRTVFTVRLPTHSESTASGQAAHSKPFEACPYDEDDERDEPDKRST